MAKLVKHGVYALALAAYVSLASLNPATASATGKCTLLGFGVAGIKLSSSLELILHTGWEWVTYDVVDRQTGQKLLLIFVGSNWDLSHGMYAPVKVGPLSGVQYITQTQGRYSGTVSLDLPKDTPDRELVYHFEKLDQSQYDAAWAVIQSTCLSPSKGD